MGQSIKVLGTDPDNMNSVSRTHMVVGKSHLLQYVHSPPHAYLGVDVHPRTPITRNACESQK